MSDNKGYIVFDIETAPSKYDEYRSAFPMSKKKPGLHAFHFRRPWANWAYMSASDFGSDCRSGWRMDAKDVERRTIENGLAML